MPHSLSLDPADVTVSVDGQDIVDFAATSRVEASRAVSNYTFTAVHGGAVKNVRHEPRGKLRFVLRSGSPSTRPLTQWAMELNGTICCRIAHRETKQNYVVADVAMVEFHICADQTVAWELECTTVIIDPCAALSPAIDNLPHDR